MKQKETWKRGREHKQNIISRLYFIGHTYKEIGEMAGKELGLDKPLPVSTVRKELETLKQIWKEERVENYDSIITENVALSRFVFSELFRQYELSKEDKETIRTEQRGVSMKQKKSFKPTKEESEQTDEKIVPTEFKQSKSIEKRLGNPAYLTEARKWLERNDRLLGLYQPENSHAIQLKQNTGVSIDLSLLPPELLALVIKHFTEAKNE